MRASFGICLGLGSAFLAAAFVGCAPVQAAGISNGVVRLGVLTDMSGTYSDLSGPGATEAAKMAVEDFGATVLGKPIEVVSADHQNKADVGLAKAREWYDVGGVDAIFEMVASSVAIAVFEMTKEKHKIAIASGAASSALTNKNCSPYGIHWTYDTYAQAAGSGRTIASQPDGDTWFFVTVDYSFGHALEADTTKFVRSRRQGHRVGSASFPDVGLLVFPPASPRIESQGGRPRQRRLRHGELAPSGA